MPKERGKEWEHVKVVSKKGQSFQVQCNYCDKIFWIESGQHIRAHLGVQGWRSGLVVERRTCDLVVAGSRPGRDAAA